MIFMPDEIHQIVSTEMAFMAKEHVDDLLTLTGALAAGRLQLREIRQRGHWRD
jgi:hypothetical protein